VRSWKESAAAVKKSGAASALCPIAPNLFGRIGNAKALTYVIDASVALKWFLTEEDSQGADVLFEGFLRGRTELLAPDVLLLEVANALWKQVVLLKRLRSQEVVSIFRDFTTLP